MNLENELRTEHAHFLRRRWFLRNCTLGLGGAALASLTARESLASPLAVKQPHFQKLTRQKLRALQYDYHRIQLLYQVG